MLIQQKKPSAKKVTPLKHTKAAFTMLPECECCTSIKVFQGDWGRGQGGPKYVNNHYLKFVSYFPLK